MSRTVIGVAFGGLACTVLLVATAGAQDTPKCLSGKLKAISKKESGLLKCLSKVAAKNDPAFQAPCETSVKGKFGPAFAKADALGPCSGDMTACENNADACENDVGAAIPGTGPCPAGALKAAGKLAGGELTCHAKSTKAGDPTLAPPCISSAQTKFQAAVAKANGSSTCVADPSSLQNMIESDCVQAQVTLDGSGAVTALCGQSSSGTTTTTIGGSTTTTTTGPNTTTSTTRSTTTTTRTTTTSIAPSTTSTSRTTTTSTSTTTIGCAPIVPGNPIPGKYSQTSVAGPKRCSFNAAANKGGTCTGDTQCGNTAGACAATPWVTVGSIPAPQPTGAGGTTTFSIAAANAQCRHQACIVCGNPNAACAGVPGCAGNSQCIRSTCCDTPGFQVPTISIAALGFCTRVDQVSCGDGEVNTSNPQTGDNEVKKVADTTDPGADCIYGTGDDPPAKACNTNSGGAGADTKGKIVRTVGNGAADANGIHTRFRVPGLSTTWIENGDVNCGPNSHYNGFPDVLLTQLIINAEPSTAGATGQFSDMSGDGCAAAGQAFGSNGNGPVTVGPPITGPEPYNASSGATTGTASTIFSNLNPTFDVGFVAITPVSAISLVSSTPQSCSCTITPGCPE
jgi:hypothetical protein